jgi:hypothetical protein
MKNPPHAKRKIAGQPMTMATVGSSPAPETASRKYAKN